MPPDCRYKDVGLSPFVDEVYTAMPGTNSAQTLLFIHYFHLRVCFISITVCACMLTTWTCLSLRFRCFFFFINNITRALHFLRIRSNSKNKDVKYLRSVSIRPHEPPLMTIRRAINSLVDETFGRLRCRETDLCPSAWDLATVEISRFSAEMPTFENERAFGLWTSSVSSCLSPRCLLFGPLQWPCSVRSTYCVVPARPVVVVGHRRFRFALTRVRDVIAQYFTTIRRLRNNPV